MIAITGASGKLGRMTVRFLLDHTDPGRIVAVARSPEKCTDLAESGVKVRHGDYNSKELMAKAFRGVEDILQISTTAAGKESIRQERNVVETAEQSGVKRIIYTSSLHASPDSHFFCNTTGIGNRILHNLLGAKPISLEAYVQSI